MNLSAKSTRLRDVYDEYPPQFWMLILGIFIDRLGAALVFPFLTLYITKKFGIGMTELGLLIGLFSITNLVGSTLGGAFADRLGRKGTLIFGLIVSALISLIMGYAESLLVLSISLLAVGLFANVGGPAAQAMIADLLPVEKRAQGYGILRVVANLAIAVGPAIGGVLAVRSYLILFVADAVTSVITAIFALTILRETKPATPSSAQHETIVDTLRGYRIVLRDTPFVAFLAASMLVAILAMHLNTSLPVYLRDVHGVSEQRCGYILTLNASMVVLLQFWLTRQIQAFPPLLMAAAGSALYGLGYAVYGFVTGYMLFLAAMVVVTMGEMVFVPAAQALAARMARDDMRGRYLAAYGLSWGIPGIIAPLLAGLIMDNLDPRLLWYVSGLIGLAAAGGFVLMHRRAGGPQATSHSPRTQTSAAQPAPVPSSGEVGCSPPA